ncbi:hypothetical protein GCM10025760_02040 [Microbacterium yannicii]|uniref:Uncharacterized protein n=1 Tax=Microbacterium yannicii TaxID=671622 RepID=A0ABP9LW94_9MICO
MCTSAASVQKLQRLRPGGGRTRSGCRIRASAADHTLTGLASREDVTRDRGLVGNSPARGLINRFTAAHGRANWTPVAALGRSRTRDNTARRGTGRRSLDSGMLRTA